ncbi:MAG: phage integrase SAM-like domain-containing protein [Flavobacteriaceae bacterium]|nr:phage integrase SAM-like domain-containing protein [Flavobacteriaceae bacterium]
MEYRELDCKFIFGYEYYLKTVKVCFNSTIIKYISTFKKIVLRVVTKGIIVSSTPFVEYNKKAL